MKKDWGLGTKSVQAGYEPKAGEPRVLPLYQSTTYKYDEVNQVADLFDLAAEGHMYSRISNPTVGALEEKVNQLEGGVGALATASGQAASTLAILNICGAGSHVLAISTLYGGTYNLFAVTLKQIGIEVTFIDPELPAEEIKKHFKDNTRAIFTESVGNPGLNILDFEKFSEIAKEQDVPFIVDNTFPTPYLCRPFEHGANIVIHSTTKYIDGHASSVGGIIVDGGNFNWNNGKYPGITEPDPSYHGISYTENFKEAAYIVKARVTLMRDYGSCMSPFNAYLTNLGLETLHLRMDRHSENALELAKYLERHEKVAWVNYPGLKNHPSYNLTQKYLPKGASGVLTFGVKGGYEAGKKFMNNLQLAAIVVHVADVRSSVLHPASMTHRQLTDEQQVDCGITPDLIRVSVGIEDIEDIKKDFDQALNVK